MPTLYEIYLCRDTGERLLLLSEYFELQYQIVQQETGFCHIVLAGDFDPAYLRPDYKIAIWRQPEGGTLALEDVYLIRYIRRYTTAEGKRRCELVGANGNSILVDRVSSWEGDTYCPGYAFTDQADDGMKLIVKNNASKDSAYSDPFIKTAYFGVAANTSQGQSFKKTIKYRSLADECTARGQTSKGRGTDILWHVVALNETKYEFRTYVDQIGQDRTWPDGYNPILVTEENGMMAEPEYIWDGLEAKNTIYGLGRATTSNPEQRVVGMAYDYLLGSANKTSKYSNRSDNLDCGNESELSVIRDAALDELASRGPAVTFTFKLQDTMTMRYGLDWRFGDKITAFHVGQYYTCRIRGVTLRKQSQDEPEEITVDMDIQIATEPETG